jgi:hypothetical protein
MHSLRLEPLHRFYAQLLPSVPYLGQSTSRPVHYYISEWELIWQLALGIYCVGVSSIFRCAWLHGEGLGGKGGAIPNDDEARNGIFVQVEMQGHHTKQNTTYAWSWRMRQGRRRGFTRGEA